MSRFGSQGWIDDVVAALRRSTEASGSLRGVSLRLQQIVSGTPDGDVSYWTVFEDGTVTGGIGEVADPDVTITQDHATAVALARGDLNAQAAFMQGKLKVTGNMGKLLQHQEAIAALGPVMASLDVEY